MAGGLAAGYGTFAGVAARYLYPAGADATAWVFALVAEHLEPGASLPWESPSGERLTLRRGGPGEEGTFAALSSTCPHLGCQVHWEAANRRFLCPCHNGAFDPSGKATDGPPKEAGQDLVRYPVRIEGGLVFVRVRTVSLAQLADPAGPGPVEV